MKKLLEYAGVVAVSALVAVVVSLAVQGHKSLSSSTGYDSLLLTPSASTGDSYMLSSSSSVILDMSGNLVSGNVSTTGNVIAARGTFSNGVAVSGATSTLSGNLVSNSTSTGFIFRSASDGNCYLVTLKTVQTITFATTSVSCI